MSKLEDVEVSGNMFERLQNYTYPIPKLQFNNFLPTDNNWKPLAKVSPELKFTIVPDLTCEPFEIGGC